MAPNHSPLGKSLTLPRSCFKSYVHTKAVKRLETFRVRNAPTSASSPTRRTLLALSLGVSSLSLLHILDAQLRRQREKTGRTGYELEVVVVDTSLVSLTPPNLDLLPKIRAAYPSHSFTIIPLAAVFSDGALNSANGLTAHSTDAHDKLVALYSALLSSTAIADVTASLIRRLLLRYARSTNCTSLLYGHSTTTLASLILAETAGGRGFSVPALVLDGQSQHVEGEGVAVHYPLRELLKKELEAFIRFESPLNDIGLGDGSLQEVKKPAMLKNMPISALVGDYFGGVEDAFPAIVSNVVRTAGKLESRQEDGRACRCCGMAGGMKRGEGDRGLCYGCERNIPSGAEHLLP